MKMKINYFFFLHSTQRMHDNGIDNAILRNTNAQRHFVFFIHFSFLSSPMFGRCALHASVFQQLIFHPKLHEQSPRPLNPFFEMA